MVRFGILNVEERKQNHHLIQNEQDDRFVFSYEREDSLIRMEIHAFTTERNVFHDLSFLSEYFIKHYHPEKIRILHPDASLYKVIQSVEYYQKGKDYQWIKDPSRDLLKDSVFDEEGYIIDQGSMETIPFGWFTTREKGCGWIAAYNLLKSNGKPQTIEEVIQALEKHNFLGKVMGQDAFFLYLYLKQCKLDVFLSLPGFRGCLDALERCDTGILLYQHVRGGHYCAFRKTSDNKVHLYNAIYRKKGHIVDLLSFLKSNTILHSCLIIGCKSKMKW